MLFIDDLSDEDMGHALYIVVHPCGIWSFGSYDDAADFCQEDGVGAFDCNEIGTLKSRAVLIHQPIEGSAA